MYDAIAFAGGGNRCYWQGGFYDVAGPALGLAPSLVVGASAGAWAACYSMLGFGESVREMVVHGCSQGVPNLDFAALRRGGPAFPVAAMYREMLGEVLDTHAVTRLREPGMPDVLIAVARPPRRLPLSLAIPLGILVYQLEKAIAKPVHPRGGRLLGFRPDFVRVRDLESPEALVAALLASASVPPIMPVGSVAGAPALDGGLVDNVPVEPLSAVEARGGRTLVLVTRRYARLPQVPNRTYVQPSQRIAVGQFDVTRPDAIASAYALGRADGEAFVASVRSGEGAAAGAA
ncbi:patatin-like phospholipase family protein [Salinarimonas ramus]|uniref:Patatin n=1 Tax=Salinarimonas ramus TaxID=690164 RepID=A0A917QDH1_9HYPH|nr:patatin-like phospholipase family protein [Salinarimonas ramus]GGK43284.1 patatin [Salinarimonas ramus]